MDDVEEHQNSSLSSSNPHEYFMKIALIQARKALDNKEVPVGCVFVVSQDEDACDGKYYCDNLSSRILSMGYNATNISRNGSRHAELVAIDDVILKQGHSPHVFEKCDLYVTCEPCIMCASALSYLGVKRVFFGCHNTRFGGNGSVLNLHEENGSHPSYQVTAGLLRENAIRLFREFYSGENDRAPDIKRKRKSDHAVLDK